MSIILIIKIHEVQDLIESYGSKRAFADAVGILEQNVNRYLSGHVVIGRDNGGLKLDKEGFWRG